MMLLQRDDTTTVVLRGVESDPVGRRMLPTTGRERRRSSRWGRAIAALGLLVVALVGMVFSGGLPGTSTPPANAAIFDNVLGICQDPEEHVPSPEAWPGVAGGLSLIGNIPNLNREPYTAADSPTAYEWWGTAGLFWEVQNYEQLGGDCGLGIIGPTAGNLIATIVFQFGLVIGDIGLTIYAWALNVNAIEPFLDSIGEVLTALKSALFLEYLIPIVMLGAVWMMWVGLVKRRSSEAVQGAVWMVFASAATLFFLSNPVWLTENLNKAVTSISTTIVDGTLNAMSNTGDSDICNVSGAGSGPFSEPSWRKSQCQIWQVYMFTPWSAGMFGPAAGQDIQVAQDVPAVEIPGKAPSRNLALVFLDSQAFNHNEVIDNEALANFAGFTDSDVMNKKKEQWLGVYNAVAEGEAFTASSSFTGQNWSGRLGIAFVTLVALIAGAVPILFLAFTLVLMQFGTVFLLLAAPLFLTLGIHPGFGRRIAISWAELLLSLQVKRIGTALLLALLLAVFQAVLRSTDSWIAQATLIGAASLGLLVYRKRILDQLSRINLGGGGGNSLEQGAGQMGKRAAGTATGAVSSGTSAAMTGAGGTGGRAGSFLVGAALGSMMGRGGNPMTAARMGASRGAAIGRRRARKGAAGGETVDPNSVEGIAAAERAEQATRAEEERNVLDALGGASRRGVDVDGQADLLAEWSRKRDGRAVPVPAGNDALREALERRGIQTRRVGEVDPRVERASGRIADAVNENAAQMERHTDTVVDVTRDATREMNTAADEVRSEVPVRPEAAGGGSDAAAQALERARRAQAVRQRKGREARERGAQGDGSTGSPTRPMPTRPDSAAPRPPAIPDPDGS